MKNLILINGMWSKGVLLQPIEDHFKNLGYNIFSYKRDIDKTDSIKKITDDIRHTFRDVVNPVLVGHSMGGFLALKLAEQGFSNKVIAICPALPGNFNQVDLTKLSAMYPAFVTNKFLISKNNAEKMMMQDLPKNVSDKIYAEYHPEQSSIIRAFAFRLPSSWLNEEKLQNLEVLICGGKKDQICPFKGLKRLNSFLKKSNLIAYEGFHYPHYSYEKDNLFRDMENFLSK